MIREYAVVGGGIGGCSIAALLNAHGHDVVLIEKERTLGGCASTFIHEGNTYNAGATTISGFHEGGIVKRLFNTVGVTPKLISSDPAIAILQGEKSCIRYRNLDTFIEEVNRFYPHPKHDEFWKLVHSVQEAFYALEASYYYSNRSRFKKIVSLFSFYPLLKTFRPYLFFNAKEFITRFYGDIDSEFFDFLEAQILIVAQASCDKINFFTAALALGYTFNETHYPVGGMGAVCETLTSKIPDVRKGCPLLSVKREGDLYHLTTAQGIIRTRNLIMGTSHYESSRWFDDKEIRAYYATFEKRNNQQSAFLLYMKVKSDRIFDHHYQLISDSILPYTLSKSLFVSFSDPSDTAFASGYYHITASIHTDSRMWLGLSPSHYKTQKSDLHDLLQGWICDRLCLQRDAITQSFAATPKTFSRYINRTQLGGNALTLSNSPPLLPSNDTPIRGFYQVGDTSYAAQGWPGVVMGAFNCMRLIHG
ncbi:MAG: FAD-dependent oxidoreductase [Sulfuricurvum sp.]|jgi:phytoene dehydrogenase-like protein|uniref:phytoene desaturase family protein n=1 Tax=Sulfuricurvum sp. TaxID=2025608 RepID=UPI0025D2DCD9|nr:FAD-dependent oxidoreductase [Sulfuricurvum sp.]MCK9372370.1 FAD-dependent oxidoreductase [Sulfuricurvum sp.]